MTTEYISFAEFKKLEIRIGTIIDAQKVVGKDKLLLLKVDCGDELRELVAGIAEYYSPEELKDKQIPVLMNLEAKEIAGIKSQGMILAVDVAGKPILLQPDIIVPSGSVVR